jgi:hypothetical protein
MEHRWGQRRPSDVAVKLFAMPSIAGTGRLVNISATGALLETRTPLRLLSVLYLQPAEPVPDAEGVGRIAASVVRYTAEGVGLEWCEFGAEATAVYLQLAQSSFDLTGTQQLALLEQSTPEPLPAASAHALERLDSAR